ncbi:MAG: dienelactone hydrolase family protein [Polyangiales bacterium]
MTQSQLESVVIDGPHGPLHAQLALPSGQGPFPAVLLLQEGLGVTQHLLRLAQRYAAAGYATLVPNLYSHEPAHELLSEADVLRGLPIARGDAAQREKAFAALPTDQQSGARRVVEWFDKRNPATYFPDTQAVLAYLKQHPAVRSHAIASIGFSLGGGLSAQLAAAGADLAAGVIFYGQGPAAERASALRYPLLGHYAENDPSITPQVPALQAQLKAAGKHLTAHVYPGTQHGFFSDSRPVYQRDAAELAQSRTLEFLAAHLNHAQPAAAE